MKGRLWIATLLIALAAAAPAGAQVLPPILPQPPPSDPNPPPSDPNPQPGEPTPPQPTPAPPTGPVDQRTGTVADGIDAAHSRSFDDPSIVPPLAPIWRANVVESDCCGWRLLAADGRVFVTAHGATAYDQATGKVLWQTTTYIRGMAYDGGALFASENTALASLDPATGAERWRVSLDKGPADPVASGGYVYAISDDTLHAWRESDGAELWKAGVPSGAESPALDDSRVYVGASCANTAAFNRTDGSLLWTHKSGCSGGGNVTAAVHGGRVWVPDDPGGGDPVLDAASGAELFSFSGAWAPAFVDGLAIPFAGGMVALDETTGQQAWNQRSFAMAQQIGINHDIFGIANRGLAALDAATGAVVWTDGSSGAAGGELAVAPGRLFFLQSGKLTAYEPVLKPAADDVALGGGGTEVSAGHGTGIFGVLGTSLRMPAPAVELQRAGWHRGKFRRYRRQGMSRDGGFGFLVRPARNTRYRAVVGKHVTKSQTVYVYPNAKFGDAVATGRNVAIPARVVTPGVSLAGRSLVLYLNPHKGRRLRRIATARLSGKTGSARARVVFAPLRHVGEKDTIVFCVRGQLDIGLGRPSSLTRRCGVARLPKR